MTDNTKMREAFEKWAERNYILTGRDAVITEDYADSEAQTAWKAWQAAQSEQAAELERLRKDAERYRWLRDNCSTQWDLMYENVEVKIPCEVDEFDSLDNVVDAAMQERQS